MEEVSYEKRSLLSGSQNLCTLNKLHHERLNIMLLTTAISYSSKYTECLFKNRQLLAAKDGNSSVCILSYKLSPGRSPAWSKILYIKHFLHYADAVFWIDGDALVAHTHFLPSSLFQHNASVVLSSDFQNSLSCIRRAGYSSVRHMFSNESYCHSLPIEERCCAMGEVNTGVMFLKNTKWTHWFLDEVYSLPMTSQKYQSMFKKLQGYSSSWKRSGQVYLGEQPFIRAMRHEHPAEWAMHVKVMHFKYMNSWCKYFTDHDWIWHGAGPLCEKDSNKLLTRCERFNDNL